jgi:hypothetical protein
MFFFILFSLLGLFGLTSCTPKEEEQEPDYENIVMEAEEDGWEGKMVADLDPQEFMIADPELKTENFSE